MISKFRAWDKESKEMLEVGAIDWYMQHIIIYPDKESAFYMKLDSVIIEQSTGMKDIENNEMYVGDILIDENYNSEKYRSKHEDNFYVIGQNEMLFTLLQDMSRHEREDEETTIDREFSFKGYLAQYIYDGEFFEKRFRKIGNIHEHPELLED